MSNLAIHRESSRAIALPFPGARVAINIRQAVLSDLKFIDALQKQHSKMVGFASTEELTTHIREQTALIAEEGVGRPIGYCLYRDRYMKREDCGYVSQLNVAPSKHRGLVGAALIKAVFERVPYGVRLFCCWCAQDLQANHFWEAIGFVPLAFRSGSRGTAHGGRRKETRMHIFWQRRVREGDEYPYWFPSQTAGGRMGEARIVLPIPPGTHWSDAKPSVLPGAVLPGMDAAMKSLPAAEVAKKPRTVKAKAVPAPKRPQCGMWFAPPKPPEPTPEQIAAAKKAEKANKPKAPKMKNDPKLIAAARELRDRYTEQINAGLLLPRSACGKYDVSRQLEAAPTFRGAMKVEPVALLNAA